MKIDWTKPLECKIWGAHYDWNNHDWMDVKLEISRSGKKFVGRFEPDDEGNIFEYDGNLLGQVRNKVEE